MILKQLYSPKEFSTMKYRLPAEASLFEALTQLFPQSSKSTFRKWVQEGRVLVDGMAVKKLPCLLKEGQVVTFGSKSRFLEGGIRLIFEDNDLVVIDKPPGLLSVATDFEKGETAHAILKKFFRPRPIYIVHRIDQETSGVMCFALSVEAREILKETFASHNLLRRYVAIVEGHLRPDEGTWKSYLYEDRFYKMHTTQNPVLGQLAITHYLVERRSRKLSRVLFTLETGRKNQIRVQCQEVGHPIVGDRKYGAKTDLIKRLALHAERLEFKHPITQKDLVFTSSIPDEIEKLVKDKN